MSFNYKIKIDATVSKTLEKAKDKINELKEKVDEINSKTIKPTLNSAYTKTIGNLKNKMKELHGTLAENAKQLPVFGNSISSVITKLGPVGMAIGVAVAGLSALGLHALNTAKEFQPLILAFGKLAKGKELEEVVAKGKAIKDTFGISEEEIAKASNTLQKEFGLSGVEAMNKLQTALIATNGKLNLDDINEFASQIKSVGGDADKLLKIGIASEQEGLFSNKSLDAVKEFGIRIREGNKATKELLDGAGINSVKVLTDIQNGAISQEQAFKQIFTNLDKLSVQKQQELISGLLGGAGEDLGARGIKVLTQLDGNLDSYIEKGGEAAKHAKEKLEAEEKLAKAQVKTSTMLLPIMNKIELIKIKLQTAFEEFINPIVQGIISIGKELGNIFGNTETYLNIIKIILTPIVALLKSTFNSIKMAVQFIGAVKDGFVKLYNWLSEKFIGIFDRIFGEGSFSKIKDFINKIVIFFGAKWNQLLELMNSGFQAIKNGIAGNFNDATKHFEQSKLLTKKLFSMDTSFGSKEKSSNLSNPSNHTTLTANTNDKLNAQLSSNVNNAIQGSTSEVKNITLNLEALQKVGQQIVNNGGDIKDIQILLQQALLQVANDINSL